MTEPKTRSQRQREYRQRAIAKGGADMRVILSPVALASLEALVKTGLTKREAINQALTAYASMR